MLLLNSLNETYDLVVVGGGPGGSTLATIVAMHGHSVLLLERELHPRYQIGESLLPSTIHGICRMIGVEKEIHRAGFIRKHGAVFRWGNNPEPWSFGFSQARMLEEIGANFAYQVERCKFDKILIDNARLKGVNVRERCDVRQALTENGRIVGVEYADEGGAQHSVRAQYVADASGNQSRLHGYVGKRIHSEFFRNVAVFGYFENGKRLPSPNDGNILCEAFDRGWIWYIPLRNSSPTLTSVGLVIGSEHASELKNPESALLDNIARCPKISGMLAGATRVTEGLYGSLRIRRDWSYTNERFWKPGIVLIGDAACFVDPVLSTGVHLATYSALLAARSINTCLTGLMDEARAFTEFERRYRLEYELFYNYLIAFYDMHNSEDSYFWQARKVLNTSEQANEAFVRLVAGGATAPDIYFASKEGIGQSLQRFADQLDTSLSAETRGRVTAEIAGELHEYEVAGGGDAAVHGGLEDIRQISWGSERVIPSPAALANGELIPSADGFHWTS